MRDLILSNGLTLLILITVVHLCTLIYFIYSFIKNKKALTLWMVILSFGLFYDSFIISLGGFYGGAELKGLSQFRYIFHGGFIPFLFTICAYSMTEKKNIRYIILAVNMIFTTIGITGGILMQTVPTEIVGITRYVNDKALTPAWVTSWTSAMSFGTVIPLIICGAIIIWKQHTSALFLSGLLMFIFTAIGPATGNMDLMLWLSMIGEVFMILFFVVYNQFYLKKQKGIMIC